MNHLNLLAVLIVLSSTAMGLLSLWAIASRRTAFVRATVVSMPMVCLAVIPAFEPIIFFLVQLLVIFVGCHLWPWRFGTASTKFSLKALMSFAFIAAAAGAVVIRSPEYPARVWWNILLAGVTMGLATLFAAWAVLSPRYRFVRVFLALFASVLLAVPVVILDEFLILYPDLMVDRWSLFGESTYASDWDLMVPGVAFITMVCLVLAFRSGFVTSEGQRTTKNGQIVILVARAALFLVGVALVLPCLVVYLHLIVSPVIPQPSIPSPNGYDDIVSASESLVESSLNDLGSASADALAREIAKNETVLKQLRAGLAKPAERIVDYESEDSLMLAEINGFRALALALAAEGRLAEHENRYGDAAASYVDIIRLSHSISRGGLEIDWLVGQAIEAIGLEELASIHNKVTVEQSKTIDRQLRSFKDQREPYEQAVYRERIWEAVVYGWMGRLDRYLQTISYGSPDINSFQIAAWRREAILRLLILELAIERYKSEHGVLPEALGDIGAADDWVIGDPFSPDQTQAFIYKRKPDGYLLYSVGVDGEDGGGRDSEDIRLRRSP